MKDQVFEYQPGVCNLGASDTRARFLFGIAGALLTAVVSVWLLISEASWYWRLMIFFPAFLGALGFVQALSRFCVAYGFLGIFRVGLAQSHAGRVEQIELRRLDRRKAWQLIALAFVIAAGITACVAAFPASAPTTRSFDQRFEVSRAADSFGNPRSLERRTL